MRFCSRGWPGYFLPLCLLLSSGHIEAENSPISPALTVGLTSGGVYDVNLTNGSAVTVATFGERLAGVALLSPTTAIIIGPDSDNIYNLNLTTRARSLIATIPGAALNGAALLNNTTLITLGSTEGVVYSVNLATGASSIVTTIGHAGISGVALLDLSTALVASPLNSKLYRVNLNDGSISTITTIPSSALFDVAVLNSNQAIAVGIISQNVYSIDLTTGQFVSLATLNVSELEGVSLVDPSTALVVSADSELVYQVNLNTGQVLQVTSSPLTGADIRYIALGPRIFTSGLSGNNLALTNYLNAQAPYFVIRLFNLQNDINIALESAAPTRNAFSTFAAQTTQLLSAQPLVNHFSQFRLNKKAERTAPVAGRALPADELLAANDALASGKKGESGCRNGNTYTPWIEFFGDLASEKEQHQTPAFSAASGGVLAAFDYNQWQSPYPAPIGFGLAYAYTHLHQDENMGHADLNQGAAVVYGEFSQSNWYFDLAVWGGYYHADNERKIAFPGFSGKATSSVSGWQLSPHFEAGYDFWHEREPRENLWIGMEPFAMADWVSTWEGSLRESGTDGLNFGQKGRWASMLRAEAGLRFNEQLTYGWGTVTLREKASYAYQKAFGTGSITAFLIGSGGAFNVTTLATAQNLGVAAFELLFRPRCTNYPYGSIAYQGEFGSKYMSNQLMLTLGMNF